MPAPVPRFWPATVLAIVIRPGGEPPRLPSVWDTATPSPPTIDRKYVVVPVVPS